MNCLTLSGLPWPAEGGSRIWRNLSERCRQFQSGAYTKIGTISGAGFCVSAQVRTEPEPKAKGISTPASSLRADPLLRGGAACGTASSFPSFYTEAASVHGGLGGSLRFGRAGRQLPTGRARLLPALGSGNKRLLWIGHRRPGTLRSQPGWRGV